MSARTLCVFGTASDVGKSLVATALCRLLSDRGYRVAPFKAQNMSNNSAVTPEGGEIGRAQFVQACAARVTPHVDMNPVLLKPSSDQVAQVILLGEVLGSRTARQYFTEPSTLGEAALAALQRVAQRHEVVVVEGAGSCAEVNLRSRDFVNFQVAHAADASVLLVADIDRGGVFAQIVGTLEVLPPEDRRRIRGVLINRFRGDRALFDDGVRYLEERTGLPVVGVLPFLHELRLEAEDGLNLHALVDPPEGADGDAKVRIAVVLLPHISNFTDFDGLAQTKGVALHFLSRPRDLHSYDLVILPGSKSVRDDLAWMLGQGWGDAIGARAAASGPILGICGGYQMLGENISDPHGVEGAPGQSDGLGLLPIVTTLKTTKIVARARGFSDVWDCPVEGYEIHMGESTATDTAASRPAAARRDAPPFLSSFRRDGDAPSNGVDGAISGRTIGTYLHGLFEAQTVVDAMLRWLDPSRTFPNSEGHTTPTREAQIQLFADHFARHVDVDALLRWLELRPSNE